VSSQHQAEQYGLKTQIDACQELADRMGWEVVTTYSDTISGTKITRRGLDQLREDIRLGKATAVVAYHLDRLNRDPAHHYMFVREMKNAGARIYYASKGGRPVAETDDDEFIEGIEALVAFRERSRIRTRTLDARRRKARDGQLMGNGETPFGYRRVGEKGKYVWEVIEEEAEIVRLIFQWYASEKIGVYLIVRRLTERHTPTPSDARQSNTRNRKRGFAEWNNTTVYKILRNSSYIGKGRTFRQVVLSEDEHGKKKYGVRDQKDWFSFECPAIIAQEWWDKAQARLNEGKQQSPRNSKYEYLMGRRIRCDECKAAIVGRPAYKGLYRYYTCGGRKSLSYTATTGCTLPVVRTEVVDAVCWTWVSGILLDEASLREKATSSAEQDSTARKRIEERQFEIAAAITDLDMERKRYQSLYGRGRMTDAEFDEKDDDIKAQRAMLERDLERLHAELDSLATPEQLDTNLETAAYYRTKTEHADFETKRGIIEDLDVVIVLYRKSGQLWGEIVSHVFRVRDDIFINDVPL
jgi:site-specific DNA recombinase